MTTLMAFVCNICEEQSTRICVRCTKDTCSNHLCEKCGACSDCCDCEIHLEQEVVPEKEVFVHPEKEVSVIPVSFDPVVFENDGPREPDEPRPHPMPDPDPAPEPDPMPE